ncbi:MAG: GTPase ObgE [Candidatus Bipolaricaulota bacterium]|nr:MAG: GTPase ObgE [Candidatus Bipolaricaulota bacterium]
MLIDEAAIRVRGGRGGNGVITFAPSSVDRKGPPDGGSGGPGGAVYLEASASVSTLHGFRNRPLFRAGDGVHGASNNRQGACGEDLVVHVPLGTVVIDGRTHEALADLAAEGDRILVAEGGEAGRGNRSFTTSRRQAPRICERGLPGEERLLQLELKLLADVGIIGAPNAGKSTLIRRMAGTDAKVAEYPFTTIAPNLGVVDVEGLRRFVAVDIPGLVEGAHSGRGLGDRFLRHIERTRVLIHVVDLAGEEDPLAVYRQTRDELAAFNPDLSLRVELVAGNKVDLIEPERVQELRERFASSGVDLHPISAADGDGVETLIERTFERLAEHPQESLPSRTRRVYRHAGGEGYSVERSDDAFTVRGNEVEKLVRKLVLDNRDAQEYLADRLERMGVLAELRRLGLEAGQTVKIGKVDLEFDG